jgi:hypothetical protein
MAEDLQARSLKGGAVARIAREVNERRARLEREGWQLTQILDGPERGRIVYHRPLGDGTSEVFGDESLRLVVSPFEYLFETEAD